MIIIVIICLIAVIGMASAKQIKSEAELERRDIAAALPVLPALPEPTVEKSANPPRRGDKKMRVKLFTVKNYNVKKLAALCLLLTILLFAACQTNPPGDQNTNEPEQTNPAEGEETVPPKHERDARNIDAELAYKLRCDYQKFLGGDPGYSLDTICVIRYLGNFSGCEVAYMGSDLQYTQAENPVDVAGYMIVLPTGQEPQVHYDSNVYTIKEAYEAGLITKEDVYSIGSQVGVGFLDEYPILVE